MKVGKSKYIVMITSAVRILIFSSLSNFSFGTFYFYLFLFIISFCSLYENILCEYLLLISTKRANKETGDLKENHLPYFYGFRAFGTLLGQFFGGRIIDKFGISQCFYINSILPLVIIFVGFSFNERVQANK